MSRLHAHDLKVAAAIGALLALMALAALFSRLKDFAMRTRHLAALAAACLLLTGCSTMSGADRAGLLRDGLNNIQNCDRDYWANTGLPGSVGFRVTCRQPQQTPAELAAIVAAAVRQAFADAAAAEPPASPK